VLRFFLITLCLLATSAHAEVQVRRGQGVPAPTQPVTTNNLDTPIFQSDTRNLQAILDKDETPRVTRDVVAKPKSTATPLVTVLASPILPAPVAAANEEQDMLSSSLMAIRVFAIRWRDTTDIFFLMLLVVYVRKLYVLSREQQKILSHSIRSAEYSAAAAKRSADICEILLKHQEKPDETQGKLDL